MKKTLALLLFVSATLFASSIEVEDAYVRATPPGLPNSAAFMTLKNESSNHIDLLWAKSAAASAVELHTHDMKNGVMKMYQVAKIELKANMQTTLKPGGFHIMLIGLKNRPLKVGQKITLTLGFSNGEEITIKAPVKTVMGGMMKHKKMDHSQMNHGNMN